MTRGLGLDGSSRRPAAPIQGKHEACRERERERDTYMYAFRYTYIYIYIYTHLQM